MLADLHLAPTQRAVRALLAEGVDPAKVLLVGNTVIDAVLAVADRMEPAADPRLAELDRQVGSGAARLMLVTAHRRESWGQPLNRVLEAVDEIVAEYPDLWCVLPTHPNPAVRAQVRDALGGQARVVVTEPLPYSALCRLLAAATVVLSDSGGIQEEAPTFRVPVLVLRDVTERKKAVDAGWAQLVGTDPVRIVDAAKRILDGRRPLPVVGNPFGDGKAGMRSAQAVAWLLGRGTRPEEFTPANQDRREVDHADAM